MYKFKLITLKSYNTEFRRRQPRPTFFCTFSLLCSHTKADRQSFRQSDRPKHEWIGCASCAVVLELLRFRSRAQVRLKRLVEWSIKLAQRTHDPAGWRQLRHMHIERHLVPAAKQTHREYVYLLLWYENEVIFRGFFFLSFLATL